MSKIARDFPRRKPGALALAAFGLAAVCGPGPNNAASAQEAPPLKEVPRRRVVALGRPALRRPLEFRLAGAPEAENPFDPDEIRVDGVFTLPDGSRIEQPAFWFQDYRASLVDGKEKLTPRGAPHWRLRFTPTLPGRYRLEARWSRNGGAPRVLGRIEFRAPKGTPAGPGFARLKPGATFFSTDRGEPLPLVGHCLCWHHQRGTADYADWFEAMADAGENYARLWMAPWAFGIETDPDSLNRYRLDRAWQLDRVFRLAFDRRIYLMLCLDYHGMFETEPDYWGGNNYWLRNPYAAAQGGPCAKQNDFFTNPQAAAFYRKRLRYLIARYGPWPNLLAWQFFNEIDNVYKYLNPKSVALWHAAMGDWLKSRDPWRHLVTTSATGGSVRPELWALPQMDFTVYHSYNEAFPVEAVSRRTEELLRRFQKPVMIGEFGANWRGWRREEDPYLRGWRQGVWTGALSGSVGTSMSWWWEAIHSENLYPYYKAFRRFAAGTSWGRGAWTPIHFPEAAIAPEELGDPKPNAQPFAATLTPNAAWGGRVSGRAVLAAPEAAAAAARNLNCFLHGSAHADLRMPFQILAWLGDNARLTVRVNSVANGAALAVLADGREIYRKELPNKDGQTKVNGEYNESVSIDLPAGKHTVELRNPGSDWVYVDWVRLEGVLPAEPPPDWRPSPAACGIRQGDEALVYVVNPSASYPANATTADPPPLRNAALKIPEITSGLWEAAWRDPASGRLIDRTRARADASGLRLPLPDLREDAAGALRRLE